MYFWHKPVLVELRNCMCVTLDSWDVKVTVEAYKRCSCCMNSEMHTWSYYFKICCITLSAIGSINTWAWISLNIASQVNSEYFIYYFRAPSTAFFLWLQVQLSLFSHASNNTAWFACFVELNGHETKNQKLAKWVVRMAFKPL